GEGRRGAEVGRGNRDVVEPPDVALLTECRGRAGADDETDEETKHVAHRGSLPHTPAMTLTRRAFASALAAAAAFRADPGAQRSSPSASSGSLTDVPGLLVGHWTDT